jgi:hypothetical protein
MRPVRRVAELGSLGAKNALGIHSTMALSSYANLKKPDPDEIVIRYTSLAQFIWIVTQQKLPLIRLDLFRDPFEGSAPKSLIEHQMIVSGGRNSIVQQMRVQQHFYRNYQWSPDPPQTAGAWWADMSARRRNRTYSTHASCWRWGPESEGMWRLYCGEKGGVALQTTFSKLEKSVEAEPILAGKIQYEDYDIVPAFKEDLDHVMYKRDGFAFEQEVRLLRADQDHHGKLCNGTAHEKLPPCLSIPWNIGSAIDRILVSPYADEWYLESVQAAARLADEDLEGRVTWSRLRKSPDF